MTDETSAPRALEPPPTTGEERLDALARLIAIVDRLRAPDGCPWDLAQSVTSMAPSLIEEAYEMVEAIERDDLDGAVEEAGDVLLVVCLICRIAQDEGRFDLGRAARAVGDKLIRRHPHVFGDKGADSSAHALANWEAAKRAERREKRADASALAGVPEALPALQRIHRIGSKAVSAGFQWDEPAQALAKLEEEVAELRAAFDTLQKAPESERAVAQGRAEDELGDVLLAAAQFGVYLGVDSEAAARRSLRRFESRFRWMEAELGGELAGRPLAELVDAWGRAKARESAGGAEPDDGRI